MEYLTVLDNILLPYRLSRGLHLNDESRGNAVDIAHRLGLGKLLQRRPGRLSQGEKQRVAVCRALGIRPQIILADEPTANLDSRNANRVLDALQEYASENLATLAVVSHDRETLERFNVRCDVSKFCGHMAREEPGEVDFV